MNGLKRKVLRKYDFIVFSTNGSGVSDESSDFAIKSVESYFHTKVRPIFYKFVNAIYLILIFNDLNIHRYIF